MGISRNLPLNGVGGKLKVVGRRIHKLILSTFGFSISRALSVPEQNSLVFIWMDLTDGLDRISIPV
jgi:hypothetical protein